MEAWVLPDIDHPTSPGPDDLGLRPGVTHFSPGGYSERDGCLQAQARPGEGDGCPSGWGRHRGGRGWLQAEGQPAEAQRQRATGGLGACFCLVTVATFR